MLFLQAILILYPLIYRIKSNQGFYTSLSILLIPNCEHFQSHKPLSPSSRNLLNRIIRSLAVFWFIIHKVSFWFIEYCINTNIYLTNCTYYFRLSILAEGQDTFVSAVNILIYLSTFHSMAVAD